MSSVLKKARLAHLNSGSDSNGSSSSAAVATAPSGSSAVGNFVAHTPVNGIGSSPTERLSQLRESLKSRGLSAYLVETQDAHQSEYVSEHDKRRAWLTGFNGSAGTALVTANEALLWTDGRYFLQVGFE